MVANSHPDSIAIRRLVRESLAAHAAPPAKAPPAEAAPERAPDLQGSLEEDVTTSIRAIERVVENFGTMRENFQFYRDLVHDLRAKLDEERSQREDLDRELVAMERIVKSERERAVRAEMAAKSADTAIKDLEQQLTSVRSQTARLVKSVTMLIAAEIDARGDGTDQGLRLVS